MHAIAGDDLVGDVAAYLGRDAAGDERAWTAFTALREAYRAEEVDGRYRLSHGDDRVLVGPPSLDILVSVYNRGLADGADAETDRWNGGPTTDRDFDRFASETRDELAAVMDRHYHAFGVMDTFVYRDDDTIAVLEEDADHVDPVDRPQEGVPLRELADFYRMARDVYGDVDACREMFGLMRGLYGVGEFGYEVFHDLRRDHTLLFDREDVRLVDPREQAHRVAAHVDIPDIVGAEEPDPAQSPPHIDFDSDETVFEQLFDTDTFGTD